MIARIATFRTYITIIDGAAALVTVDPPDRVGQIFFHVQTDGKNRIATMYTGVNVGGTLAWVPRAPESTINGYTGKPIDPIYD